MNIVTKSIPKYKLVAKIKAFFMCHTTFDLRFSDVGLSLLLNKIIPYHNFLSKGND